MATIHKKVWPESFELILSGKKRFDLRLADFEIKEGDTLVLEEWDPKTAAHTGRTVEKKVDYIFNFDLDKYGQKEDVIKKGLIVVQIV